MKHTKITKLLQLDSVRRDATVNGVEGLWLQTNLGTFPARYHIAPARETKQLILYPGCRHGLEECREAVDRNLLDWLRKKLLPSWNEPGANLS